MSTELGYIIVATRDDGTRWYLAVDRASTCYEYFTSHAASAEMYPTQEEAEAQIKRRLGDVFLHDASGADYEHPVRRVNVAVEVVSASRIGYNVDFAFEISAGAVIPKREWKALAIRWNRRALAALADANSTADATGDNHPFSPLGVNGRNQFICWRCGLWKNVPDRPEVG